MIQPRCYVCGLDLFDVPDDGRKHFTLVYFGKDADAKMAPSRAMAELRGEGHPNNAIWFCNQHTSLARQHQNTETSAALRAIDAATGRNRQSTPGM